jgi:hypothetical protein
MQRAMRVALTAGAKQLSPPRASLNVPAGAFVETYMSCAKPNPVPLPASACKGDRDPEETRNVFCAQYSRCIDVAIREGWESFTCTRCHFFRDREDEPRARDFALSRSGDNGL